MDPEIAAYKTANQVRDVERHRCARLVEALLFNLEVGGKPIDRKMLVGMKNEILSPSLEHKS